MFLNMLFFNSSLMFDTTSDTSELWFSLLKAEPKHTALIVFMCLNEYDMKRFMAFWKKIYYQTKSLSQVWMCLLQDMLTTAGFVCPPVVNVRNCSQREEGKQDIKWAGKEGRWREWSERESTPYRSHGSAVSLPPATRHDVIASWSWIWEEVAQGVVQERKEGGHCLLPRI